MKTLTFSGVQETAPDQMLDTCFLDVQFVR